MQGKTTNDLKNTECAALALPALASGSPLSPAALASGRLVGGGLAYELGEGREVAGLVVGRRQP